MNCQQTCLSNLLRLTVTQWITDHCRVYFISLRFLVCSLFVDTHSNSHPTIDLCTLNTSDPNIYKEQYRPDTTSHETDPSSALCLPVSAF